MPSELLAIEYNVSDVVVEEVAEDEIETQ